MINKKDNSVLLRNGVGKKLFLALMVAIMAMAASISQLRADDPPPSDCDDPPENPPADFFE